MSWPTVTLDDLKASEPRSITDGPFGSNLARRHYTASGPRVVRLQNIGDGVFVDEKAHISEEHFLSLRAHEVLPGDLLVASLGEVLPRACIAPADLGPAIVKADCIRVRLRDDVDARWVLYALQRPSVRRWADEHRHGVGRPRLGLKTIRQIPIPLPPQSTQGRIVAILEDHFSRLDAAVKYAHGASVRSRIMLERTMSGYFTEAEGKATTLGAIAKWGSGGTPSARTASYYEGGTIPWLNSGDLEDTDIYDAPKKITELGLAESSAKWVPEGSVLVAMYGATIGKTGLARAPVTTNQAIAFATPHEGVSARWLQWYIRSQYSSLRAAGKGGAQPNISQAILKAWPVTVPSPETQLVQVGACEQIDSQGHALRSAISAANQRSVALRRSLLEAAFAGRLTRPLPGLSPLREGHQFV